MPPYSQNNNGNPPEIEMEPSDTSAIQFRFGLKWLLPVRFEVSTAVTMMIIIFWEMIIMISTCSEGSNQTCKACGLRTTTLSSRLFGSGYAANHKPFLKRASGCFQNVGKMCWLRRGVRWRLTCASKCLAIMVFKKKIQSRSYLNHLVFWLVREDCALVRVFPDRSCAVLLMIFLMTRGRPFTAFSFLVISRFYSQLTFISSFLYLRFCHFENKIIYYHVYECDPRRCFGLDIGSIDHFNTRHVITIIYSAIADLNTL
jgi:hypothetical protein